ncbi:TPA: hypothetical protein DF272_03970 [Candidatus Falkowbacteria bacterium]|nr:hypothetical protein [Candidatus Falkowbacteria bacterium]
MENTHPTIQDVLQAVNATTESTNKQFAQIQEQFNDVLQSVNTASELTQKQFDHVQEQFDHVQGQFDQMQGQITEINETMATKADLADLVTKDYLDNKLADLRGDLVVLTRKEDTKLKKLVDILTTKNLLSPEEKEVIFALEPFPKTRL